MLFVFLFFVFFKQKTAYEMRISDWSSDVCSSDLRAIRRWPPARDPDPQVLAGADPRRRGHVARAATGLVGRAGRPGPQLATANAGVAGRREIGRGSVWERVCKVGWCPGGAVEFKKAKNNNTNYNKIIEYK